MKPPSTKTENKTGGIRADAAGNGAVVPETSPDDGEQPSSEDPRRRNRRAQHRDQAKLWQSGVVYCWPQPPKGDESNEPPKGEKAARAPKRDN